MPSNIVFCSKVERREFQEIYHLLLGSYLGIKLPIGDGDWFF